MQWHILEMHIRRVDPRPAGAKNRYYGVYYTVTVTEFMEMLGEKIHSPRA